MDVTEPRGDDDSGHARDGSNEEAERIRRQRQRAKNVALLLVLVAFVVLIYIVSIVRMSGS